MGQPLPRTVAVVATLHGLAALVFGVTALVDHSNQFPGLVANDDGLFAVALYATRNLGVGTALLAAVALGSRWGVIGLMTARLVTDVGDLLVGMARVDGVGPLVGQAVFFGLLFASELFVLGTLWRLERRGALTREDSY